MEGFDFINILHDSCCFILDSILKSLISKNILNNVFISKSIAIHDFIGSVGVRNSLFDTCCSASMNSGTRGYNTENIKFKK